MSRCKNNCMNGFIIMESIGRKVPCPECSNITQVIERAKEEEGVDFYDKLQIPSIYKDAPVSGYEMVNVQGTGGFTNESLHSVGNLFERINKDIYDGRVMNLSVYIHTTATIDVKQFVYGAQRLALEKNLGVTPFISANTLYGIQRVGDYGVGSLKEYTSQQQTSVKDVPPDLLMAIDGYRMVQATDLTYFDFIHADVCFIEATANTSDNGWVGIADLLGERAKRGLPTYIIGYWASGNVRGKTRMSPLRFLLAPENGSTRLDLLVPFEVKTKKSYADNTTSSNKLETVGATKSDITTGLSISSIMN